MSNEQIDNQITVRTSLPEIAINQLMESGLDLNVGDIFLNAGKHGNAPELLRIYKIWLSDDGLIEHINYGRQSNLSALEFTDDYGSGTLADMVRTISNDGWVKLSMEQIAEYAQLSLDVIEGKMPMSQFEDKASDNINTNTAIIGKDTKAGLLAMQDDLSKKREHAMIVSRFVGREMEKRRRELESIRSRMQGVVASFQKKINKIMKVITTIELYLGIDEELFCIQEGEKAPADTPITFRQAVLYMDEEIGHWEDGGLDFSNIDWFDKWLVENDNYKSCFPEEKRVVVFRPRRYDKKYDGYDPASKAQYNMWNRSTYLLIRNGECLHRVYTDRIRIAPTLFPMRGELQKVMEEIQEILKKGDDLWRSEEEKKDQLEDIQYQYRKRAILMQGLIDRTEILHPLPAEKVNIFNLDELGEKVRFIYDAEAALGQGKLTFWDWHKQLNSRIAHGSRIMITGAYNEYGHRNEWVNDRIFLKTNHYNTPPPPNAGIYDVEEYKEETRAWIKEDEYERIKDDVSEVLGTRQDRWLKREYDPTRTKTDDNRPLVQGTDDYWKEYHVVYHRRYLTILHNPGDEVSGSWGNRHSRERKNRIRFVIEKGDKFLLNYDLLDLSDIEFYISSRIDRPNYLNMMPILEKVRIFLLAEQEKEKDFSKLIFQQVHGTLTELSEDAINARIEKCLAWWKYKNKLKRAITKDDTLALRMIIKRITSKNYSKLSLDD